MRKLIIASLRPGAGKTSTIIGLAGALKKDFSYLKPFGERVLYKKKKLLDYDSALIKNLFEIEENPEDMSLGFDHSKLRFMYDKDTMAQKIKMIAEEIGKDNDILFIEAGKDLMYGSSVGMDAFSLSEILDGELMIVVSGEDDAIVDDITFIKEHLVLDKSRFKGIIINKIKDIEDFEVTHMDMVEELGVKVIGKIPFHKELTHLSMNYISEVLFAKVLAGEENLGNQVEEIYIGAMSGDSALKNPLFSRKGKLIITSGDREDMCLAAISSGSAGIILTNNILPSSKILSMAKENGVPLLIVPGDTFRTAKQIDDMERLITRDERWKMDLLVSSIMDNIDISRIL
jgi:hypothetical protein